ncbi:MAG: ImmA/IrrE family metallo-endopeptidase, partial [Acidimicrobiia bacterium]|nr:ImmA/IrrE family metallo-endopeptidase [Acidimicrobiia bacterium]
HELAHIWIGESALDSVDLGANTNDDIEGWCNRVAAEILVPLQEIRAEFNPRVGMTTELQRLAQRFKTSRLVVLRRLRECDFLTWDEYQQTFQTEYDQALKRATGTGGDFYNTQPARVGKVFAQAVIASTLEGDTSYTDAFQLLGFKKTSTFYELADRLGVT